ncbi:MAG: hypothetical protein P9M15_05865, partial [Candidatus Electryoneaceae bacterium]|nr:hypothetical protein [Candidatus Electryoneaceae bacterium]
MKRSAIVSIVLVLVFLLTTGVAYGQHFQFVDTDGDEHTLLVSSATIDGDEVVENDEIGVFTPARDQQDPFCAGAFVVGADDDQYPIVAQGELPMFEQEGFRAGEVMSFKIWDASAEVEFDAT